MEQQEEWKTIDGPFGGRYEVSNMGRVRDRATGEFIPKRKRSTKGDYPQAALREISGKIKCIAVHRLVAFAFVPGYQKGLEVNHKDCNQSNPKASNLEWVTHGQNVSHGFYMKRFPLHKGPAISALDVPKRTR